MARINLVLPDSLFCAAKRAAHIREVSLSEYIRMLLQADQHAHFLPSSSSQLPLPLVLKDSKKSFS